MSDAPLPSAANGMPLAGDPPMLWIDWGCQLEIGANLQPEFHLYCPAARSRPQLMVEIDRRLDHEHWAASPVLKQEGEGLWSFVEPLEMTAHGERCAPGRYGLELRAVFHEPGQPPRCFRADVPIAVRDPEKQQTGPVLEIEGGRTSMVNLMGRDLSEFSRILLKVGEAGVVNIQESLYAAGPVPAPTGPPTHISRTLLKPDLEMQGLMPRVSAIRRPCAMNRAALLLDDGQRFLLLAQPTVLLGRGRVDKQSVRASDICLRVEPAGVAEHDAISELISRVHLRMTLQHDGLHVRDESSCGTFCGGEKLAGPLVVGPGNTRLVLALAGVFGLEITGHCDPTWNRSAQWTNLVETAYYRAVGAASSPLWPDARAAGLDAVRLCRQRRLPIDDHWSQLARYLGSAKVQSIQDLTAAVDRVDSLAGREQYVLVFRTATLGGSPGTDPICLPQSGLGAAHARIVHLGGAFWLEPLVEDDQIGVEGRRAALHELVPLVPGVRLTLGRTQATFAKFSQAEL